MAGTNPQTDVTAQLEPDVSLDILQGFREICSYNQDAESLDDDSAYGDNEYVLESEQPNRIVSLKNWLIMGS
jgi:hypothetical protein